jgi:hypothetical protein
MDFYKFWQILEGKLNEWDPNEPDEGPDHELPRASGDGEIERELRFENGTFVDLNSNKAWPPVIDPKLNDVIGEPGDTYEMFARLSGQMSYVPGQGEMGNPDSRGPEVQEGDSPEIEVEELWITNKRTGKQADLSRNPVAAVRNLIGQKSKLFALYSGGVYNIDWDFHNGKVSLSIK